jgi:uncharacterized membrane protein
VRPAHLLHLQRLQRQVPTSPINVNELQEAHQRSLGLNGKVATLLTGLYGSMYFVYFLVGFCGGWMLWQSLFSSKPFDPLPFIFLLFLGNFVQLLGGPIIQVGQNLQSRHSELRAEADYLTDTANADKLDEIIKRLARLEEKSNQVEH